jgi:two-component system sensor histidine kinase QseC
MSETTYSGRRRLVAATLLCMVLIFTGIGVASNLVARHESEELFSARLATSARVLEGLMAQALASATLTHPLVVTLPRELETASGDEAETFGHRYETKVAFQVWRDDGTLLAHSASAPVVALAPLHPGFSQRRVGATLWQVFALKSGPIWVLTAEKDEVRNELAKYIGMSILAPLIVGGLLLLGAVNVVLLRGLRPIEELATRIAARKPDSLAPISLPATPFELVPIIRELNHLLGRIKAAFEREQRFINAAAHEIRTPIAALQLHLENALRSQNDTERTSALTSALAGARRTSKLAEQLLALGRLSARSDDYHMERLSLNDVCCDVIGTSEPLLAQRGQSIGLDAAQACYVWGELSQLRRLVQNLIDNASVHGAPGGDIQVTLAQQGDDVVLSVANDGVPIPENERTKLFIPYYRPAGAAPGGHGLGLAIVKEIADQHGASVLIDTNEHGQGTVVQLRMAALALSSNHIL